MRRLLGVLGVVTVLWAALYIALPVGHIPPYDANLVRLAESPLEAWCSGAVLWMTAGSGDAGEAQICREDNASNFSSAPDMSSVERVFCDAVVGAGFDGTEADCLGILRGAEYWPTYDGSITNSWNRARPYPGGLLTNMGGGGSTSRTGGHQGPSRPNPPTHGVTSVSPVSTTTGPTGASGATGATGSSGG